MAQRRMFSNRIANSAKFLQMPAESQLLYFHFILHADDDGIVESYPVMRLLGLAPDNFKVLIAKGFIQQLNEDQVIIIKDWTEHNIIRADRKVDSIYKHLIPIEIRVLQPKTRSDRPHQLPETRTNIQGRPVKKNNGTVMGRHRLGKDRLGEVRRETWPTPRVGPETSGPIGQKSPPVSETNPPPDNTPPTRETGLATSPPIAVTPSSSDNSFDSFWQAYPKKEKKKDAKKIWARKKVHQHLAKILAFIPEAKKTDRWVKGFIPQPPTFLNGERWTDDLSGYADKNKNNVSILKGNKNKYDKYDN